MAMVHLLLLLVLAGLGCSRKPPPARPASPKPEPSAPLTDNRRELTVSERWQLVVEEQGGAPRADRIAAVNIFFNQLQFAEDRSLWGTDDYWATLPETLARGGGDCEDLALGKYFTLRHLNIPDDHLRITYTISLKTRKAHMVLALMSGPENDPLILDTDTNMIFPVSRRPDLLPVYSFNQEGYWLARKKAGWRGEKIGSAARLSMWRRVLQRMKTKG